MTETVNAESQETGLWMLEYEKAQCALRMDRLKARLAPLVSGCAFEPPIGEGRVRSMRELLQNFMWTDIPLAGAPVCPVRVADLVVDSLGRLDDLMTTTLPRKTPCAGSLRAIGRHGQSSSEESVAEPEGVGRHVVAIVSLQKLVAALAHVNDDASLYPASRRLNPVEEFEVRSGAASLVRSWLTLDSHEAVTATHRALLARLDEMIGPERLERGIAWLPLDIKLAALCLKGAMYAALDKFYSRGDVAHEELFRRRMRYAEAAARSYLLAEEALE